jgi:[acyl-carrier-protein] S-malonyltransferase
MPIDVGGMESVNRSVVLLFAGQGAQEVGMGKSLASDYEQARLLIERADHELDKPLSRVMFSGPVDELTRTSWCQPALYTHGLACWEVLKNRCPSIKPAAAAGLSLGEFTAHAAAGTFDFSTGLSLVAQRGRFMDEACAETDGSMAAMIGGEEDAVRALAAEVDVDVANLNAPGQVVLSGSRAGIAAAVAGAKQAGLRMGKELEVAGAYHSRLMRSAQDKLAGVLEGVGFAEPAFPVIANVDARPVDGVTNIRETLERQVTGSVRWSQSMELLLEDGHETFIEFGPKPVLAGLMNRIRRGSRVISISDTESMEAAVTEFS